MTHLSEVTGCESEVVAVTDRLTKRAAERGTVTAAMEVSCPDPAHRHAQVGIPCTAADEDDRHEWGWVCASRIEHEAATRPARAACRSREEKDREKAAIRQHHQRRAETAAQIRREKRRQECNGVVSATGARHPGLRLHRGSDRRTTGVGGAS